VFQTVSVAISVLTLTFISVDRWYAICFPLKFKSTTGRAKTAIIIIWLLALAVGKHAHAQKTNGRMEGRVFF
jgi:hypocretin (orexin) receptor 2